jgi:hypothetical protein
VPRPIVSPIAEELYSRLGPWAEEDTARGVAEDEWDLLILCEACIGKLQGVEDVIRDQGDAPGWSQIMDVDRTPNEWLAWTAQLVGVQLRAGLGATEQRLWVKGTGGFRRGSPGALIDAGKQYLSGTKTVFLTERSGSAYQLVYSVYATEAPNHAALEAAVIAVKPAGIVITFAYIAGGDYATLLGTHATYAEVMTDFATYAAVLADPAHT